MRLRCFVHLIILGISGFVGGSDSVAKPTTIPAIREWTDANGSFTFSSLSRIVISDAESSTLLATANTLSRDLQFLSGRKILVLVGPALSGASAGDIVLGLSAGNYGGTEGYKLIVSGHIEIFSDNPTGVFYGTRTVLQLLKQGNNIKAGVARDWPDYPERGLMVDVGRKFFSIAWLRSHVVELSYLKLNLLHLHLSDDLGLRIASEKHPEIVSDQSYSKFQIRDLIALATEYHVQIIPEIDVPGHTGWLKKSHPDLLLGSNSLGTHYMDLTKPEAYLLVKDLLEEYLPEFPSPYWHTGGDEYIRADDYAKYPQLTEYAKIRYGKNADGIDVYLGFLNEVNKIVRSSGKRLRTWADAYEFSAINSQSPVPLDTSIVQELWNAFQDPIVILSKGFSIQNASFHPTYYNLGAYQGEVDTLYEDWAPHRRMGGWGRANWGYPIAVPALTSKLLGAKLSIWCDNPGAETEAQVAEGIRPRLRALAQNSWGTSKLVTSFSEFLPIIEKLGRAPGYGETITIAIKSKGKPIALKLLRLDSDGRGHAFPSLLGRSYPQYFGRVFGLKTKVPIFFIP